MSTNGIGDSSSSSRRNPEEIFQDEQTQREEVPRTATSSSSSRSSYVLRGFQRPFTGRGFRLLDAYQSNPEYIREIMSRPELVREVMRPPTGLSSSSSRNIFRPFSGQSVRIGSQNLDTNPPLTE